MITLGVGAGVLWHAFVWFNTIPTLPAERKRLDGNAGHAQIDFGGQWVMGRMLVKGYGRELYHRQRQWQVVEEGFAKEYEPPLVQQEALVPGPERKTARAEEELRHDHERMMGWFMGTDSPDWRIAGGSTVAPLAPLLNPLASAALERAAADRVTEEVVDQVNRPAIGGPLYPPIHAFLYAPLGLIDRPQLAYRVFQVAAALFVVLAGLGISLLSRGRIWWSAGTLMLFLYPGLSGGLDLGQNPSLTLCIAVWGWALAARGYAVGGGMAWGIFAFKPVWGLALFLVPVMTLRWRFCIAMVLTGLGLAAATLPFVGIQTWLDWLAVGKEAADLYKVNLNWITLSRDLQGIPRRILHDFSLPEPERDTALAAGLAWLLWGVALAATVIVYLLYGDRRRSVGVGIAFLFFGAYLTCYHFMYYDALVSAVGFAVLLAEPQRLLRRRVFSMSFEERNVGVGAQRELHPPEKKSTRLGPRLMGVVNSFPLSVLAFLFIHEKLLNGMNLQATLGFGYFARVTTASNGATGLLVPKIVADTGGSYPTETFLVIAVWLWCGWQLIRGEERPEPHTKAC
jgi:hypothetical protein